MSAQAGRDRVLARALIASALIHVSAVTLFRIVIEFPRKNTEFFHVSIVQSAPMRPLSVPTPELAGLQVGAQDVAAPALGETLTLGDPLHATLPEIELPTLPFEELSLVRLRQEALEVRSRYDELFASQDSFDLPLRIGAGLDSVSERLGRLTFGGTKPEARPRPISRPAPGFEAYVEWLSEPKDRQVFDVQPIEVLRGLGAEALPEPVTLVFRVNRDGVVSDVFNPVGDTQGLVAAAVEALRRYRFAPLIGDGPEYQGGTFILHASQEAALD